MVEGAIEVIFIDPFVQRYPEGAAKLIKCVKEDRYSEIWEVEFRPGVPPVQRRISNF